MLLETVRKFCDTIKVYDTPLLTKVRIGPPSDGGYIVIDEISAKSNILFSYGIGNDIRFEEDFVTRYPVSAAYCFDPTIDALPEHTVAGLNFMKEPADEYSLIRHPLLYNPHKLNITLKIDVEWAEWNVFDVFEGLSPQRLMQFDQILCEFHIIPAVFKPGKETPYFRGFYQNIYDYMTEALFKKYTRVLELIQRTHTIVHVHANNSLEPVVYGDRGIPQLIEMTFVRNSLTAFIPTQLTFPVPNLDFPNKSWKPDIIDWYPLGEKCVPGTDFLMSH